MFYLGWLLGGIALLSFLFLIFRGKGFLQSLGVIASNFVLGFGSLYAVNVFSAYSDFSIPVNLLTVAGSGFLGLPGTMLAGAVQALAGM
jgi:pro-sigmaK processing inhibitor BofA